MSDYLVALALTLVVEVPLYVVLLSRSAALRRTSAAALAAMLNLCSHPLAFLVVDPLLRHLATDTAALIITELGVIVAEAALLGARHVRWDVAVASSAVVNTTSLMVGVALWR